MRTSSPVLLLTQDERLAQAARLEVYAQSSLDMVVARTFEEGLGLLADASPCAVVAHLDSGLGDEQVSELLNVASRLPMVVPLIVLSDRYDEIRGRTLFQLGVADYLVRDEHLPRLAALLSQVVPPSSPVDVSDADPDPRVGLFTNPRIAHSANIPHAPLLPGLQRFPVLGEG